MTVVLVPIHYPLTDTSIQTLRHATEIAAAETDAQLLVLHVNLYQNDGRAQRAEITRAIKPIVRGVDASVQLRNAFLVEEAIADEADKVDADIVVVGKNGHSWWRHLLSRLIGNEPDISTHLREQTDATIHVVD